MPLSPRWQWKLDRWTERLLAFFRPGKNQSRPPRLCPACGTLVGSSATRCHECGASMSFSLAAVSRSISSLLPEAAPVTYVILSINFAFFVVTLMRSAQAGIPFSLFGGVSGEALYRLGARNTISILREGEFWRLITAMFLHGGLFHFGMNTLVLVDIGSQVEEVYGSARFLFLYIFTGIAGFVASTLYDLYRGFAPMGIGASGALMGLIGLMLAITYRRSGMMMQQLRSNLFRWLIYIGAFGLLVPGIDNAAHLGGLAAGFLLGRVTPDRQPANVAERHRAYALAWSTAGLVVLCFALMLRQYFRV